MTDQAPELLPLVAAWLDEQIAQAASQQAQSYSMAGEYGQRQGERWHARQVALYEAKLKLAALTRPPSERPVAQVREQVIEALKAADEYARHTHNANGWWNDRNAWHLIEKVIKPVLAALTAERPEAVRENLTAEEFAQILPHEEPGREMIQATSSASDKVCDHPSTEKADQDLRLIQWLKEMATDFAFDNKTDLKQHICWIAAERLESLIANPANSLRGQPESSEPSLLGRETVREAWKPTEAQVRSACLSYRHDFGLLSVSEAVIVKSVAREWLRAWQKEGAGADRNEIIEECAKAAESAAWEGDIDSVLMAIRSLSPLKE